MGYIIRVGEQGLRQGRAVKISRATVYPTPEKAMPILTAYLTKMMARGVVPPPANIVMWAPLRQ